MTRQRSLRGMRHESDFSLATPYFTWNHTHDFFPPRSRMGGGGGGGAGGGVSDSNQPSHFKRVLAFCIVTFTKPTGVRATHNNYYTHITLLCMHGFLTCCITITTHFQHMVLGQDMLLAIVLGSRRGRSGGGGGGRRVQAVQTPLPLLFWRNFCCCFFQYK